MPTKHELKSWEQEFNRLLNKLFKYGAKLSDFPDEDIARIYALRDMGMTPAEALSVVNEVADV